MTGSFITTAQILLLLKVAFLLVDFMFIIFLIVVLRQVFTMNTIVHDENDEKILKAGAFILLLLSISLFFFSVVIL
jgi:hypothetical protein